MTEKQTILGRITQLTRANINAMIDRAEDPQLMLDQLIRDYTNSIAEAEGAIAQTIGNLRLAEQDHAADLAAAKEWGGKAAAASQRADTLRAQGSTPTPTSSTTSRRSRSASRSRSSRRPRTPSR